MDIHTDYTYNLLVYSTNYVVYSSICIFYVTYKLCCVKYKLCYVTYELCCIQKAGTNPEINMTWTIHWTPKKWFGKLSVSSSQREVKWLMCPSFNPLMPNGVFNICCPRDCVSRHNGGTSGPPLNPSESIVLSKHYRL